MVIARMEITLKGKGYSVLVISVRDFDGLTVGFEGTERNKVVCTSFERHNFDYQLTLEMGPDPTLDYFRPTVNKRLTRL